MSTANHSDHSDERRCWRLRWKGLLIDVEPDPDMPVSEDGGCWCTHTMNCLGPDGQVATREKCLPERNCFETR